MNAKILVVDDNKDLLQITQIILKAQGYIVFTATTIDDAKRKLKIHQPALLLLDVSVCDQDDGRVPVLHRRAAAGLEVAGPWTPVVGNATTTGCRSGRARRWGRALLPIRKMTVAPIRLWMGLWARAAIGQGQCSQQPCFVTQ